MLAISIFVDEAAPNIQKYFKERMPGSLGENLQKILSVAVFVCDGLEERQKVEQITEKKKKTEVREANLLAAALARNLQMRGQGWRGGRSDSWSELRPGRRERETGRNAGRECYYCGNLGHLRWEYPYQQQDRTPGRDYHWRKLPREVLQLQ